VPAKDITSKKMKATLRKNTLLAETANNDMLTIASRGSASGRESSPFQSEIPAKGAGPLAVRT
jgi:hypothetical protein